MDFKWQKLGQMLLAAGEAYKTVAGALPSSGLEEIIFVSCRFLAGRSQLLRPLYPTVGLFKENGLHLTNDTAGR